MIYLLNYLIFHPNFDLFSVVYHYKTTVGYDNGETKTFDTEKAFIDTKYLEFINDDDNKIIKDFFKDTNDDIKRKNEVNAIKRKEDTEKRENIKKEVNALYLKEKFLKSLFGGDFIYPTYRKFKIDNGNYFKLKPEDKNSHINFVPEFYMTKTVKTIKRAKILLR